MRTAKELLEDIEEFCRKNVSASGEIMNAFGIGGVRADYIQEYGWSIPTAEAVLKIAEFFGDLETVSVGCGHGTWEALLADLGVRIRAFDKEEPGWDNTWGHRLAHATVLPGGPEQCKGAEALFLSWPHWQDTMAEDCLENFTGSRFVFVGEGWGGCTGTDEFFALRQKQFDFIGDCTIPRFYGIRDYVSFWRRK